MRPTRIVISGASSGIGEALARLYAGPGIALALVGRDRDRLAGVAAACRAKGGEADEIALDVRDRERLAERLRGFDADGPVDLVVANAGVALPANGAAGADESSRIENEVNFLGALNTTLPLAPAMAGRGRGQIAFVSSLAAYAPLPSSPGYGASKAAVLLYGLSMRERLRPAGVRVNVVCPGYVDTPMGARYRGWRPLAMSAEAAAFRIRDGLAADRAVIAFPRRLAAFARASQLVPEGARRFGLKLFRFSVDERA